MDVKELERIKFISVNEQTDVDLKPIYQAINVEKSLLHPTLEKLQESYAQGLSVVMSDDSDQIIGHVRLTPLLDDELKLKLGLSQEFPRIWEVGSAIIKKEFRGRGYYAPLRNALVERYIEDIEVKRLLILGTTKTVTVLKSLPKAEEIGAFLQPCHHLDAPMVAAFTCVCKGKFGQGFQFSVNCPSRISKDKIPINGNLDSISRSEDGSTPCVMYTSSPDLSLHMNISLMNSFGSSDNLVKSLENAGHYQ